MNVTERQIINWSYYKRDVLVRLYSIYSELESIVLNSGRGSVKPTSTGLVRGKGSGVCGGRELRFDFYGDRLVKRGKPIVSILSQLIHITDQIGVVIVYSIMKRRHKAVRSFNTSRKCLYSVRPRYNMKNHTVYPIFIEESREFSGIDDGVELEVGRVDVDCTCRVS